MATIFLLVFSLFGAHEYHVSTTTINYNAESEAFEIILHAYIDDLELALEQRGHKRLFLGTELETETAESYLRTYIERSFVLKTGEQLLEYTWLGYETTKDLSALNIYLEIPKTALPDQLTVEMPLLTEVYDDQQNVIHVSGPTGLVGYILLRKNQPTEVVTFKS